MKFNKKKIIKNNKTLSTGHKDRTVLYFISILLFLGCLLLYKTNIINISALNISNKFSTKDKSIIKPLPKPQVKLQAKKKEAKKKDNIKNSFELKLEAALEKEKNSKIKSIFRFKEQNAFASTETVFSAPPVPRNGMNIAMSVLKFLFNLITSIFNLINKKKSLRFFPRLIHKNAP